MQKPNWTVIHETMGNTQALLIESYLKAYEVETMISSEGFASAMGLSATPSATVQILVRDSDAEEARRLLKGFFSSRRE